MRFFTGSVTVLIVIAVLVGMNFYIARHVYRWLTLVFPGISFRAYIVVYLLLAVSLVVGFMPLPALIKSAISLVSSYWMGLSIYLFLFLFASDVVILLGKLVHIIPSPIPSDVMFFKGLAACALAAGVLCYGLYNANQVRFTSYDISIGAKEMQDELKIILISDLHLGSHNAERNLVKVIEGVNSLEPDVVCIAGDIFNDAIDTLADPERVMNLFKSIETVYGVYASIGNHDGGRKFDEIAEFLTESGVKLLLDDYDTIDGRFIIVGRVDRSPIGGLDITRNESLEAILPTQENNLPVIVMDHNPARIDEYGSEADLIVAGHTHRGQLFPGNLITNAMYSVHYGHYQKDVSSPHVIVTSGAGTWGPPIRVGSNNEIVCILVASG